MCLLINHNITNTDQKKVEIWNKKVLERMENTGWLSL